EVGSIPEGIDLKDPKPGSDDFDCQVVPSGPGFESENNLQLFLSLLYAAQERAILVSPYFVPDEALLRAVASACNRGVQVDLFVSETRDRKSTRLNSSHVKISYAVF